VEVKGRFGGKGGFGPEDEACMAVYCSETSLEVNPLMNIDSSVPSAEEQVEMLAAMPLEEQAAKLLSLPEQIRGEVFDVMAPDDWSDVIDCLPAYERSRELFRTLLVDEDRAGTLADMEDEDRRDLWAALSMEERAAVLDGMAASDQAAVLKALPAEQQGALLAFQSPQERAVLLRSMSLPERLAVLGAMSIADRVAALENMPEASRAMALDAMPSEERVAVLQSMSPRRRRSVEDILAPVYSSQPQSQATVEASKLDESEMVSHHDAVLREKNAQLFVLEQQLLEAPRAQRKEIKRQAQLLDEEIRDLIKQRTGSN